MNISVMKNDINTVKGFLEDGVSPNHTLSSGDTPLMAASGMGNYDIARLLMERGASINAVNRFGQTPLMFATSKGGLFRGFYKGYLNDYGERRHVETVSLLLKKGANVNAQDTDGFSVLMITVMSGDMQLTQMILDNKANLYLRCNSGLDALAIARERGNSAMIALLEKVVYK
jgi:ankyrin repeat protein